MANPVAHFEISGDNPTKLAGFYQSPLRLADQQSAGMDYWVIHTGQTDAKGAPRLNNEDTPDT